MIGYILIGVGVVAILGMIAWPVLKGIWPFSLFAGTTAGSVVDKITTYANQATAAAALASLAISFKLRGDTVSVNTCADLWRQVMTWDDAPVVPTTPAVTVESLALQLAALQATLASVAKPVSTVGAT